VDPLDRVIQNYFGWIEFSRKHYDSAAQIFQSVAKSYPSWSSAYMSVGFAQTQAGKLPEALAAFDRARLLSADSPSSLESYAYVAALAGKQDEARLILRRLEELSKSRRISSYDVALIYLALGDRDTSIRWLERGFTERDPWMIWLRVHPEWDPFRSDPRFQALLAKMNL
jgi:tetratricopeptide (TPR) repeat protein